MSIIRTIPADEGMSWVTAIREDGRISLTLRDDDSGEYLPSVRIFSTEQAALAYIASPVVSPSFVVI